MRRWKEQWPPVYGRVLALLLARESDGRGLRQFLAILALHQEHPAGMVEAALERALQVGAVSADGVKLCLRELYGQDEAPQPLALQGDSVLATIGHYSLDMSQYDRLLAGG